MSTQRPRFLFFASKSSNYLVATILLATTSTPIMIVAAPIAREHVFHSPLFWVGASISGLATLALLLDMTAASIAVRHGQGDLVTNPIVNVPLLRFVPPAAVVLVIAMWPLAVFFVLMCRYVHMPWLAMWVVLAVYGVFVAVLWGDMALTRFTRWRNSRMEYFV